MVFILFLAESHSPFEILWLQHWGVRLTTINTCRLVEEWEGEGKILVNIYTNIFTSKQEGNANNWNGLHFRPAASWRRYHYLPPHPASALSEHLGSLHGSLHSGVNQIFIAEESGPLAFLPVLCCCFLLPWIPRPARTKRWSLYLLPSRNTDLPWRGGNSLTIRIIPALQPVGWPLLWLLIHWHAWIQVAIQVARWRFHCQLNQAMPASLVTAFVSWELRPLSPPRPMLQKWEAEISVNHKRIARDGRGTTLISTPLFSDQWSFERSISCWCTAYTTSLNLLFDFYTCKFNISEIILHMKFMSTYIHLFGNYLDRILHRTPEYSLRTFFT